MRITAKACIFLVVLLTAVYSHAEVIKVSAEKVNLRAEPTTNSDIVATVTKGTLLGVLEKSGYWNKVKVLNTGQIGYIHSALADATATPPPEIQPSKENVAHPVPPPTVPERTQPEPPRSSPPPAPAPAPPAPQPRRSEPQAQVMEESSDKSYRFTLWGGFHNVQGSHLSFGGVLGFLPFSNPAMEVEAGADYVTGDVDALSMHGSINYIIDLEDSPMSPYLSGGLAYARSSSYGIDESEAALQLGGGLKIPINGGQRYFRGDLRFGFFRETVTRFHFGITF